MNIGDLAFGGAALFSVGYYAYHLRKALKTGTVQMVPPTPMFTFERSKEPGAYWWAIACYCVTVFLGVPFLLFILFG